MSASYKRIVVSVLMLGVWLLVAASARAQADAASQILAQINRARSGANVPALTRNAQLDAAAQGHANDLLQNGAQLGHRGSDGSTIAQRIARAGYTGSVVGENWAAYQTLDQIMTFWLNDPPHIQNIDSPYYREIGIGVAGRPKGGLIIVTDFGAPQNAPVVNQAPPPAAPAVARPATVPVKAKPKATAVATRKPTRKPTSKPTRPLPAPTLIAMAQSLPIAAAAPLHVRAGISLAVLRGRAKSSIGPAVQQGDTGRMVLGGGLAGAGALLLGVALMGYSRSKRREKL